MSLVLAFAVASCVALVVRFKILPALRRTAAAHSTRPRTIGGSIVVAELLSKVATAATIAFGSVMVIFIVAMRGSRASVEAITKMLRGFESARELHATLTSGWIVLALIALAIAYFSAVHRRSSSLFHERLETLVSEEIARLEHLRSKEGWPVLDDNTEVAAIRADIATVEARRVTAARAQDDAAAALHDRHLKELWGKLYFADRDRRIDMPRLVNQVLSERPATSNAFVNLLTSRLAVKAMPRATKVLAAFGLPLLLTSLVGLRAGYVREKAESHLADLRVLTAPEEARRTFEAALGTLPKDESEEPDDAQINAIARAYELRWLNMAARPITVPHRDAHRYDDIRARILDEYAARARSDVALVLRNVDERRPQREPQTDAGRRMRDALRRIGKQSTRELNRILTLAREADVADLPHSSRSEVADALLEVLVNGALGVTPAPGELFGDIAKEAIEDPARKFAQSALDAEVMRAATNALAARTKDDLRRALGPVAEARASTTTMQPILARHDELLSNWTALYEERAYTAPAGITIANSDYDRIFPVLDSRTADAASLRPYDPDALAGFAHVGGVIIGTDPAEPNTLDFRDLSWQITAPDAMTLQVVGAEGSRTTLGPYHPAVVAQALAYVADDRRAAATAGTLDNKYHRDFEVHPSLDGTPLGVRAVLLDLIARAYAGAAAAPAFRQVYEAMRVYADLVLSLQPSGDWKALNVAVRDLSAFSDSNRTPFTTQDHIYDAHIVKAIAACRAARFFDELTECVQGQLPASVPLRPTQPDNREWMYGVREMRYTLSEDLAFARQQPALKFVGQLTYRCDPLSTEPCLAVDPSYVDRKPWAFPKASAEIDRLVRQRAYSECRDIVGPMEDFTRLGRLFRAALRGSLGARFPSEKLVRLARETAPFVRKATIAWPRDPDRPCKGGIPAL